MTTLVQWELSAPAAAGLTQGSRSCPTFRFVGDPIRPTFGIPTTVLADWNRSRGNRAGEIKPHTTRGISAGVAQLVGRTGSSKLLFTYRKRGPNTAQILASGVGKTQTRGTRPRARSWYDLGTIDFDWQRSIPIEHCPACVGAELEGHVRRHLKRLGFDMTDKTSPYASGPDVSELEEELEYVHELLAGLVRDSQMAR